MAAAEKAQNVDPIDRKKYNKMEPMLQYINANFITVSKADNDKVQPILGFVLNKIVAGLKENALFKKMYTNPQYGGSSYSGLKVGKPEEFDLDLKLDLPALVKAKLELSDQPGFVKYRMTDWETFEKNAIYNDYKGLEKFKDSEDYLLADKVLNWFKSLVAKCLNALSGTKEPNQFRIAFKDKFIKIRVTASGPAVTLRIACENIEFDVDLVIVFKINKTNWPSKPFKEIPLECGKKTEFLLVPKPPKIEDQEVNRCWRMSFQEQENVLLNGTQTCKTALRIIKKIRDKQNHKMISSYFLKTVFLHEYDEQSQEFWSYSLSFVLMHMLKKYKTYLEKEEIPYYWNEENNLLQHIDKATIYNFKCFISKVIDSVDRYIIDNPYKIADYISTPEEYELLTAAGFVAKQIIKMPAQCSDSNATIVEKKIGVETDHDKTLIFMLKGIQTSINVVQSDVKCALKKITDLDNSVQDLKNDNIALKTMMKGFVKQKQFTEEINRQELLTADIKDQIQCLNQSLKTLKNQNDTLKKCFQTIVLE